MADLASLDAGALAERVVVLGDLDALKPIERAAYYSRVCESVGLNPMTRPFEYIRLQGKLTLYARRDATDQLRRIYGVSVSIVSRERHDDVYVVTARAATPDGRTDESVGAVPLGSLKGEALANALMKAETKAKRRVTLSICGLGWLDETEVASIAQAQPVRVDADGVIHDVAPALPAAPPRDWAGDAAALALAIAEAPTKGALNEAKTRCAEAKRDGMPDALLKDLRAAVTRRLGELADPAPLEETGQ
jgi:hypothetical protein